MLQLYSSPSETGFRFVLDFFVAVLIGSAFGLCAFLFPRINWAHQLAYGCCHTYGSSLSIAIQGVSHSFWAHSELEREMCLIRIRQLMNVTAQCKRTLESRKSEAEYEPHSGVTLAKLSKRIDFLNNIGRIVSNLMQVVENIAVNSQIAQSSLCKPFGERMEEPLGRLASAMDSTLLKICDMTHPVSTSDLDMFRRVREEFQERLSNTRQEVILSNEDYRTDESDIYLGCFLFCVDELAEAIENFQEPTHSPSRLREWLLTPWTDLLGAIDTIRFFLTMVVTEGVLIRRAKEAIKLALSMTIPFAIQVFLLNPEDATPVAGPSIIAWVYQKTGAESFHYASNRVLGTVIGSLTALISVQLAGGRLWLLYIFLGMLSLVGNFVQTSSTYTQAGNALVFSVISIISQYKDDSAAMGRIQQNVFAILIYFGIAYVFWPVRAIEKLSLELDGALRAYREAMYRLLGNLDGTCDIIPTCEEVDNHLTQVVKHIQRQQILVPAAVKEPTLVGSSFPEQPWLKLVRSQETLASLAWMMLYAFKTFESSQAEQNGDHSVHWIVVRRLASHARQFGELIYAVCDLYLLSMSNSEMVPMQHLVRLRLAMVEEYHQIVDTYANTQILRLCTTDATNEDSTPQPLAVAASSPTQRTKPTAGIDEMPGREARSSVPTAILEGAQQCSPNCADLADASITSYRSAYVLQNRDIHSLEAFLFCIRATVKEIGDFQKALLEMQHVLDINKKI
jgi:hypothetical protein